MSDAMPPTSTPPARTPDRAPLDLTGALPSGTVVLEASAGTGKTYAIAALATRAVAEGRCTLPELLIVTFTRAATAELRERIRRRLTGAEQHLRRVLAGQDPPLGDDQVLAWLADADDAELTARHQRLTDALTDFDAATISTIHGFTQQVLRSVGLAADIPRELTLLEDESALLEEVVDDVYVRRYLGRADLPSRPTRRQVAELAKLVAAHPDARLRPEVDADDDRADGDTTTATVPAAPGTPDQDTVADPTARAAERVACAAELRTEIAARKRRAGTLSYDDLLHALRAALRDPARGAQARAVLRERYRWALIDEFQDTDPVQWDILADAFRDPSDPHRALVLIGDPKQAIYSFRGADVRAYLAATEVADAQHELRTNHRSDGPLLGALDRLLTGTTFGEHDIRFRAVQPTEAHRERRLSDETDPSALQLRAVVADGKPPGADAVRTRIARDLATTLLDQLGRVHLPGDPRPLRPEQVAVLVRTNSEARLVQDTFREVDIPSVVNGVGSVLATDATDDWRWLLDALERPSDPNRIRRLALSCWIGWRAEELSEQDEEELDRLHDDAARWARVLGDHGVATLERTVLAERRVAARSLEELGGERHLTDLRHIGRLLHVAEREEDRGISSLRSWLLAARAEVGDTATPSDEQARRLESDARAVQILTVHRSKGLQFPVVCVPFSWSTGRGISFPLAVHDDAVGGRVLDVGPPERDGAAEVRDLAAREKLGEQLRLLYVAVTRAQHRAVVWMAPTRDATSSALARVLYRDADGAVVLDEDPPVPDDVVDHLRSRFADTATSVTAVPDHDPFDDATPWRDLDEHAVTLRAARFDRDLDRSWRRTSYSGLVRRAQQFDDPAGAGAGLPGPDRVATEPETTGTHDEADTAATTVPPGLVSHGDPSTDGASTDGASHDAATARALGGSLPLGDLRGGPAFGTLVHAVLEHVDFTDDDLPDALQRILAEQLPHHRVPWLDAAARTTLVEGLVAAIGSPLGPLAGDDGTPRRLADLTRADRLDELEFELPLAGGDRPRGTAAVTLARLADLLDRPPSQGGLADDDPLRRVGYADRLRTDGFRLDVRGYLNGSIDLVLRVVGADGTPRFLIADHKTNKRGGAEPTLADYAPDALVDAMVHGDYPLQALLYQVALHRFLRWRQPGYDPAVHLGGALYLFLRGMIGSATPLVDGHPCGVFAWRPPAALIADLSDLLDGHDPAATATPPAPPAPPSEVTP